MTTPDPMPSPAPVPDDATSAYAEPWPAPPVPTVSAAAQPPAGSSPPAASSAPWPVHAPAAAGSVLPPGSQPAWAAPAGLPPAGLPPVRPAKGTPPGLVAGVILVVVGGILLLTRFVDISLGGVTWPLWIVVPGVAMLVGSFFIPPKGGVGLAIPGTIITIVGIVLWVQDAYNLYATWAYAWALVAPTGPGLGMLLYGTVHRDGELAGDGLRTLLVGLGLFLGFALFFEGILGLSGEPIADLDQVLPYAIIGLGVLLVILSFLGGGRRQGEAPRPR